MGIPFAEFADDKRLLWIAKEWQRYADRLANWAMERMVNRRDVWSQYTVSHGQVRVVMLPTLERRKVGSDMVTLQKLRRHFAGRSVSHLIGLHSISDHSTCKWFAIDVDLHDETVLNADEIARANLTACLAWADRLRSDGFDPMLLDTNGVGGYHLITMLDGEHPLAEVYDYANNLRSDYLELGLARKPEIFPPRREVEPDDLPYGLRLPGRHHTRPHYTRVWNIEGETENEWLEGGEAIELLMDARPGKLPDALLPVSAAPPIKRPPRKHRARICLDLDGVLAEYNGWEGHDRIGPPIEGSLEFVRSIAEFAEIIIFTSRCSAESRENHETVSKLSPGQIRIHVIEWLERHGYPFSDVYIGHGKPAVDAFVDDRAIACRPQTDDAAFKNALSNLRSLVRGKSG